MSIPSFSLRCLLLLFAACTPGDAEDKPLPSPGDTSSVGPATTIKGDRTAPSSVPDNWIPTRLVERVRIGALDSRGADLFGKIAAITVDGLGRVYVADRFTQTVRVFDSTGVHVRSIGRDGQGPGEFTCLEGFAWRNDSTLWVIDLGNGRYSEYDTSGVHVRDRRRSPLGSLYPWPGRFDGGKLIEPLVGGGYRLVGIDPDVSYGPPRDTLPFPLAGVPLEKWNPTFSMQSGGTWLRTKIPFTEGVEWSLDGRGGVWVGDTEEYRLVRRSLSGDTVLMCMHEIQGARVTPEEKRAALDALRAGASGLDLSRVPDRKPVFRVIVPSDDGGVWLLREGKGSAWLADILNSDCQIIASLELPVQPDLNVLPVVRGRDLWIATLGKLDVPMVLRFTAR